MISLRKELNEILFNLEILLLKEEELAKKTQLEIIKRWFVCYGKNPDYNFHEAWRREWNKLLSCSPYPFPEIKSTRDEKSASAGNKSAKRLGVLSGEKFYDLEEWEVLIPNEVQKIAGKGPEWTYLANADEVFVLAFSSFEITNPKEALLVKGLNESNWLLPARHIKMAWESVA